MREIFFHSHLLKNPLVNQRSTTSNYWSEANEEEEQEDEENDEEIEAKRTNKTNEK